VNESFDSNTPQGLAEKTTFPQTGIISRTTAFSRATMSKLVLKNTIPGKYGLRRVEERSKGTKRGKLE